MNRILGCLVALAVLAPGARAEQTPAPADLARAIEIIRTSQTPADIADAYRTAKEKSPDSVELHRTYMLRMLKFGVMTPAHGAAVKLAALDPADGLAWAVKAYVDGKGGRLPLAIESAFQAAAKGQDENPSVLTALGQLLAWHENAAKRPELSDEAKAILAASGKKLKTREAFAIAYAALTKAYADAADRRKVLDEQLDTIHADMQAADAQFRSLGGQLDDANRQITALQRHIGSTRLALYTLANQSNASSYGSGSGSSSPPPISPQEQAQREAYRQSIQRDEASVREFTAKREGYERSRAELRVKGKKLLDEQAKANAEQTAVTAGINKLFRWDPPAVDGVVTPAKEFFTSSSSSSSSSSSASSSSSDIAASAPADNSDLGDRDLKLAQLHIADGRYDVARAKLERLLTRFPDGPVAVKAQALLDSIKGK